MKVDQLRANVVESGPVFPEPVQVIVKILIGNASVVMKELRLSEIIERIRILG